MKMKYFLLALLIPFLGQATQKLYVTNEEIPGSITIIDTATNTVVNTIDTNPDALDIAFLPNGEKAYIQVQTDPAQVLNVAQNNIFKSLDFGIFSSLAVLPNGTRLYVAPISNFVLVVDTFLDTIVDMIPMNSDDLARDIVITPDGSTAYASNYISDTISVIDTATNTVIDTVPVATEPGDLAVTPDGSAVYVVINTAIVSVIDTATNTVSASIAVSANPRAIAITPDGLFAYIAHSSAGGLMTVIDIATNTVATTFLSGGTSNINMVITPDGSTAYVSDISGEIVIVIDIATNTVTQTIPAGARPRALALTPPSSQVNGERIANIALGLREFSNIVTWTTPTDITTTGYLIFRDSALTDLAAEISDPNILKFEEHNLSEDEAFTYQVVALDQYNNRYLVGSGVFLNFK